MQKTDNMHHDFSFSSIGSQSNMIISKLMTQKAAAAQRNSSVSRTVTKRVFPESGFPKGDKAGNDNQVNVQGVLDLVQVING